VNRRVFLSSTAGLRIAHAFLPSIAPSLGSRLITQKRFLMGTIFEVISYTDSPDRARKVMDQALTEVGRLETVFSSFDSNSEVGRLRRHRCSSPCRLSPDLYRIIDRSLEFSRLSGGRFDVTVGPLTRLWRQSQEEGRRPPESDLRRARDSIGYRNLVLVPPDSLVTHTDHLEIDLGAIGKGFAVDRAAEVLLGGGLKSCLITAGRSSILALDPPPDESGWKIQVKNADRKIRLSNRAMSTSGQPALSGMIDGWLKGHIFDPLTGKPAEFGVSVTVLCDSATNADALSTTCLLLGYKESCRLLEGFTNLTMIWTAADGVSRTFTTGP